jgi:hypothetical protein
MIQRSLAALGWIGLAFIIYVTLCPVESRPQVASAVHWEHFGAFAVIGFALAVGHPRRLGLVILVVMGSALVLELMQLLTVDRHARVIDALVKEAGGLFGIVLGRLGCAFARLRSVAVNRG